MIVRIDLINVTLFSSTQSSNISPGTSKPHIDYSRKLLLLINPNSGAGRALQTYRKQVSVVLGEAEVSHEVLITQRANHAWEVARDLDLKQYAGLVILSGDGLLYEVCSCSRILIWFLLLGFVWSCFPSSSKWFSLYLSPFFPLPLLSYFALFWLLVRRFSLPPLSSLFKFPFHDLLYSVTLSCVALLCFALPCSVCPFHDLFLSSLPLLSCLITSLITCCSVIGLVIVYLPDLPMNYIIALIDTLPL